VIAKTVEKKELQKELKNLMIVHTWRALMLNGHGGQVYLVLNYKE
tara:strand:- start:401 stop:535 length:135 start_codon:yes stop_codon:yes gene_type:complete